MSKIYDYIEKQNRNRFTDIDFHDFIELKKTGYSMEEISKELDVPVSYVKKLVNDLDKNY